ncbi:MAG TPA: ABC transporter permease [Vicinamibacterales bacterium]|nr:ABC transporter permease [Vicinamibacterales bacterium]
MPTERTSERALGWLLCAYPRRFRERFEAGMHDALTQDYELARQAGWRARISFWLTSVADVVWYSLVEHLAAARTQEPRPHRQGVLMSSLRADVRDAWRSLRATPVVTVIAVLSLAFGVGANTALFSILNSLVYKPLPVHEPERLVQIDGGPWTNPIWEQVRDRQDQVFDGAFAWSSSRFDLSMQGESDFAYGAFASGGFFDVLGVKPLIGRTFTKVDDARGGGPDGPVAVIGYDFWQKRFGGAADIVGKPITLARKPFTIIGVLPPRFMGPEIGWSAEVIIPLSANAVLRGAANILDVRAAWWLDVMARLKPEQTMDQATQALRGVQPAIKEATVPLDWPKEEQNNFLKEPFTLIRASNGESDLRARFQQPLTILLVVVGLVLVIACANIANLLIARATARRHELSVRLALGATRWRLARQLLLESLLLAAAGGAGGLLIAQWGSQLLVRQLTTMTNRVTLDLAIDWRILIFTTAVATLTALLFGLAPALGVGRIVPSDALKERGRGLTGDSRLGVRNMLVVAQVALSLALVVAAGLFVHTFASLAMRNPGFDPEPLMVVRANVARSQVPPEGRLELFERLREGAAATPGVASATASVVTPVGNVRWNTLIDPPDGMTLPRDKRVSWMNAVTPGWFATYGVRLKGGRDISDHDRPGGSKVAVVDETFARRFFPGVDPVGRHITRDEPPAGKASIEIIGVVENTVYSTLRSELAPTMYVPLAQSGEKDTDIALTVRAQGGSQAQLSRALATALLNVDGAVALTFRPLSDQLGASLRQERLVAMLAGFFGALALVLSGLGLYGVTAYAVGRRRAEIGIRLALGSTRAAIVQLVLQRVGWLVGIGVAVGVGLSLWLVKYVASLLYGVQSRDPWTIIGAAASLAIVGLLAGWLPARRASRVDPTVALRTD